MSSITKGIGKLFGTDDAADKYAAASQQAAQMAQFAPYNVTTGFGTSALIQKLKQLLTHLIQDSKHLGMFYIQLLKQLFLPLLKLNLLQMLEHMVKGYLVKLQV